MNNRDLTNNHYYFQKTVDIIPHLWYNIDNERGNNKNNRKGN
nr:MAG TPA: hypothetical protein [Caudoviricetes sp.]